MKEKRHKVGRPAKPKEEKALLVLPIRATFVQQRRFKKLGKKGQNIVRGLLSSAYERILADVESMAMPYHTPTPNAEAMLKEFEEYKKNQTQTQTIDDIIDASIF